MDCHRQRLLSRARLCPSPPLHQSIMDRLPSKHHTFLLPNHVTRGRQSFPFHPQLLFPLEFRAHVHQLGRQTTTSRHTSLPVCRLPWLRDLSCRDSRLLVSNRKNIKISTPVRSSGTESLLEIDTVANAMRCSVQGTNTITKTLPFLKHHHRLTPHINLGPCTLQRHTFNETAYLCRKDFNLVSVNYKACQLLL